MATPDKVNKQPPILDFADLGAGDMPEEALRFGLPLAAERVSMRNPHKPRIEARPFPSVDTPPKVFVPPTAGYGPRTIPTKGSTKNATPRNEMA